jgi:hypothetical protein
MIEARASDNGGNPSGAGVSHALGGNAARRADQVLKIAAATQASTSSPNFSRDGRGVTEQRKRQRAPAPLIDSVTLAPQRSPPHAGRNPTFNRLLVERGGGDFRFVQRASDEDPTHLAIRAGDADVVLGHGKQRDARAGLRGIHSDEFHPVEHLETL